jgi:hypothetical protein
MRRPKDAVSAGRYGKPTRGFEPRTPSLRGTPRFESCGHIWLGYAEIACRALPAFRVLVRPWCDLDESQPARLAVALEHRCDLVGDVVNERARAVAVLLYVGNGDARQGRTGLGGPGHDDV